MTKHRSLTAALVMAAAVSVVTVTTGQAAAAPEPAQPHVAGLPDVSGPVAHLLDSLPAAQIPQSGPKECKVTRTGEYTKSAPASVGLDAAKIKQALNYWTANGSETVKIFRHGCLVGEGGLDRIFDRVPRQNWSQTKTVSTLVAGVAERKGMINVDDKIGKYLPAGLGDTAHRAITLRSVLNMTTGARMNWVRGLNLVGDISRTRQVMTAEMQHKPGEYYEYDQDTPSILNYVVQHAIWKKQPGLDYQEWAQRELFNKLGIPKSAYWWQRDRAGGTLGYSELFLRPLEFGRLGELMLNNGRFQGAQLIDPSFMKELATGSKANCGYGFMVWLNGCHGKQNQVNGSIFTRRAVNPAQPWIASAPSDMYYSWGYHGQHTFVLPSLDMVITRSGEVQPDALPGASKLDGDAAVAGAQKEGYFNFFKTVMSAVKDMSPSVKKTIANPNGTFRPKPELNIDPDTFLNPIDAGPGSYLAVGSQAPQGCNALGCEGEPNNGTMWVADVPRTVPGVLGQETRPNG